MLQVHRNQHEGKLGVLVLAPDEGLGVTDPELRAQHLDQITLFRRTRRADVTSAPSRLTTPTAVRDRPRRPRRDEQRRDRGHRDDGDRAAAR